MQLRQLNGQFGASKIALAFEPDNLSSIPGTYMMKVEN